MSIKHLPLFIALFVSLTTWAQEPISISQAISKGLANNYQIQIAEKSIEQAQIQDDWAVAGRYPTINFTVTSNNTYRNTNNPASFLIRQDAITTVFTPGVDLNWTLFNGHRVKLTKKQLSEQVRLNEANLQIAVENNLQQIILAYYAALIQAEQLKVLDEVLAVSRERIAYDKIRQDFGQAGTFELLQSQDAYLNDSISYMNQVNNYENAMRELKRAMGEDDLTTSYQLTDILIDDAPDYELTDLKQKMLANNKNLQLLFVNRELTNVGTQIQNSTLQPTLSLRSGLTYDVNYTTGKQTFRSFAPGQAPTSDAIPNVAARTLTGFANLVGTYTLFDGGVRKRNIETAKIDEMMAQLDIEDLKRQLNAQLETTYATYNTQKNLVKVTDELVNNSRQNLGIAEERFRGGLINSFDYRVIQLNFINASQSKLTAIFNLKSTETQLIQLIGGLTK
jgi:outer membrane protein TolC